MISPAIRPNTGSTGISSALGEPQRRPAGRQHVRHPQQQRQLGDLAGLELQAAQPDPATRAVHQRADARDQHRHQQGQRDDHRDRGQRAHQPDRQELGRAEARSTRRRRRWPGWRRRRTTNRRCGRRPPTTTTAPSAGRSRASARRSPGSGAATSSAGRASRGPSRLPAGAGRRRRSGPWLGQAGRSDVPAVASMRSPVPVPSAGRRVGGSVDGRMRRRAAVRRRPAGTGQRRRRGGEGVPAGGVGGVHVQRRGGRRQQHHVTRGGHRAAALTTVRITSSSLPRTRRTGTSGACRESAAVDDRRVDAEQHHPRQPIRRPGAPDRPPRRP